MSCSNESLKRNLLLRAGHASENSRTVAFVGISPGNSFYTDHRKVSKLFENVRDFEKIVVWIPVDLHLHSLRAINTHSPERYAEKIGRKLLNVVQTVVAELKLEKRVEILKPQLVFSNNVYTTNRLMLLQLAETNVEFLQLLEQNTLQALQSLANTHHKSLSNINIKEGINYIVGELAFLISFQHIFDCNVAVIYIKEWELLENLIKGKYENVHINRISYWMYNQTKAN